MGMIPRGEVGLIFAGIGLTLMVNGERILDEAAFSAMLVMVMVTTLVTPPLLQWRFSRVAHKRYLSFPARALVGSRSPKSGDWRTSSKEVGEYGIRYRLSALPD